MSKKARPVVSYHEILMYGKIKYTKKKRWENLRKIHHLRGMQILAAFLKKNPAQELLSGKHLSVPIYEAKEAVIK